MYWHQYLLVAVVFFAVTARQEPITRVAIIFLANAILCEAYKVYFGAENPIFNIAIDGISAWLIMRDPASTMQGLIGLTYASQIGSHIWYAGYPFGEALYWQAINAVLLFQLFLLAIWSEWYGGFLRNYFSGIIGWLAYRLPRNRGDAK